MITNVEETNISHAASKAKGVFWDESRWIGEDDHKINLGNRKRPADLA